MCLLKMYHRTSAAASKAIQDSGRIRQSEDARHGRGVHITDLGPDQQELAKQLGSSGTQVCIELMLPTTKVKHNGGHNYRFVDHPHSGYPGEDIVLAATAFKVYHVNAVTDQIDGNANLPGRGSAARKPQYFSQVRLLHHMYQMCLMIIAMGTIALLVI